MESDASGEANPRLNILLIEDELAHMELTSRMLRRNRDWSVTVIESGSIAQARKTLEGGKIDAVLTDLDLPDSFGLDTLTAVRKLCGDVPVLVLTSTDDISLGQRAVKRGADDFLVKSDLSEGLLARAVLYAIERRRSQSRLRHTTLELKRNIRDLEDFARIVSHDLKTPLAVIRMDLDRAEMSIGETDGQAIIAEALLSAQQELDFAVRLIDDLSTFARLGGKAKQTQIIDLPELLRQAADRAFIGYPHQSADATFDCECEVESCRVVGHESMLHQLFENLIGNALKYRSPEQASIRVRITDQGTRLHVSVSDNGLGIPEKDRARVVRMFERIPGRQQPGTGIGLAVASRIAEMHGGSLTITDGHGSGNAPGTAFHLSLPCAPIK
jgi:signal transduction histidine kinase